MNEIQLNDRLFVSLPDNLDLTFQIFSDYSTTEEVVCGWSGDELQYALIADDQPGGMEHEEYWSGLLDELKKDCENGMFKIVASGDYKNSNDYLITYKALKTKVDGDEINQLLHLIVVDTVAYWVTAIFIASTNIFKVNGEVRAVLNSARVIDD